MRLVHRSIGWLALAVLASAVHASADPPPDRAEIARRLRHSHRAVVANIVDATPRFERTPHGDVLIVSELFLQVTEVLKGPDAATIRLDVEGGTIGDVTLRVSDLPVVTRGQRAVFLLRDRPEGGLGLSERGAGLLPLAADGNVAGTAVSLGEVRHMARQVGR
jgi:hypothetical protein